MRFLIIILLYGVALTPLIEWRFTELGATAGKIIIFRTLIEGALFAYALGILLGKERWTRHRAEKVVRNPVAIALTLFLLSMAVSAISAANPARAFWGTIERGEGVFGVLHYLILFLFIGWFLKETERLVLLKIFLISGYALLLYGLQEIPQGISRIDSYVGNASFFAGHLLFLIAVAWIVMQESKKKTIWRYIAVYFIPFAAGGILLTKTRSAILGLGIGGMILCFGWAVRTFEKKVLWTIVGVCIVGSIGLWLGSGRVRVFMEERNDSIQTRLMFWKAGWQAFQEKPIIGWGPEHFILASSAHYNPEAARHSETWFDRAHNKILDILVSQGVFGLLVFVGLLGSVLWVIWRDPTYKKSITLAFGGAYLAHSMFTPDQFVSWLGLVVFLGFAIGNKKDKEESKKENRASHTRFAEKIGAAGVGFIAIATLYYGNILPYRQLRTLFEAKGADNPVLLIEKATVKNTFAEAKAVLLDFYMEKRPELIIKEETESVILEEARALAKEEPQDIRHGIRYARILLEQGQNSEALYDEAEQELEMLRTIAPKRQEIYYLLAKARGEKGNVKGAIEAAEHAVKLDPKIARAHFVLGVALASSEGETAQSRAEEELMRAEELNPELDALMGSDLNTLVKIYEAGGRQDRIADIALRNADGIISWTSFDEPVFIKGLLYFAEEKNKEAFLRVAAYIEERFLGQKEAAKEAIRLAKQEKWDIIQNMFEIE